MSVDATYSIFCDVQDSGCIGWELEVQDQREVRQRVRYVARQGGWTRQLRDGIYYDVCPRCNKTPIAR